MSVVPSERFPNRRRRLPPTGFRGLPVLVLGVSTHASGHRPRRVRSLPCHNGRLGVAFPLQERVGTRDDASFGTQSPGLGVPLSLLHP